MRIISWLVRILVALLLIAVIAAGWASANTWLSWRAFQRQDFVQVSQAAGRALPAVALLRFGVWHQVPDLEIWSLGLQLAKEVPLELSAVTQSLDHTDLESTSKSTRPSLAVKISPWLSWLKSGSESLSRTWFLQNYLSPQQLRHSNALSPAIETLQSTLLSGEQTWVLLFQNSDELRATGGFTGSLALVTLMEGSVTRIEIQDIYQPDGQVTGFLTPPPGVAEYLSSGNGWRLPDLNWSPDFPVSAALIQDQLSVAGHTNIKGIVSVNLEVAQQLLGITGEVFLPDYQATVTAETISTVLRQNRSEFFPGSIAKQHVLASFFTQLKLKLSALSPRQQFQTFGALKNATRLKQIQFFAIEPSLEQLFREHGVAGQVPSVSGAGLYVFPIESNVGINKANREVVRRLSAQITTTQTKLTWNFYNTNLPIGPVQTIAATTAHLHYVNYHRLLLKPDHQVTSIIYNGQKITDWDQQLITTSGGEQLLQLGFLFTVPEQSVATLEVTIVHQPLTSDSTVVIGKQSGIESVPLNLEILGQHLNITLIEDLITTAKELQSL